MVIFYRSVIVSFLFLIYDTHINSITIVPDECQACALGPEEGFESLETMDFEADGANFDSYNVSKTMHAETVSSSAAGSQRPHVEINSMADVSRPASHCSSLPPSRLVLPPPSPPILLPPSHPMSPAPSPSILPAPFCQHHLPAFCQHHLTAFCQYHLLLFHCLHLALSCPFCQPRTNPYRWGTMKNSPH